MSRVTLLTNIGSTETNMIDCIVLLADGTETLCQGSTLLMDDTHPGMSF